MDIIFNINGGIGKCIAATAVCEAIKKKYPTSKLVVVSAYPEVFITNPHVNRSLMINSLSYFYSDYIEGKDILVFSQDPYLETAFIKQEEHLIKTWCEMFDVPYNGESPKIYLTEEEINNFSKKYVSDKPILLLQSNGGAHMQQNPYSWARDIPEVIVKSVIKEFSSKYLIAHVRRDNQPAYDNTTPVIDNFRSIAVLFMMSHKRLLMDSFGQHLAAALNLPSTVLWIANKPQVFGYEIHDNIIANPETKVGDLRSSFLQKYDITGDLLQFPYNNQNEIFDVKSVLESLKK